ncbi:MAG: glycosyltransferase family 4 protein [Cyclobacteriaceae bacterium]
MKISILAHHPFPIKAPYAGGLEMQTHILAKGLQARGHDVTIYAHEASDSEMDIKTYPFDEVRFDDIQQIPLHKDFNEDFIYAHHGYLSAVREVAKSDADIVHLNCLHHTPFIMHELITKPVIASLHTLPLPFLQSAIMATRNSQNIHYTAVSGRLKDIWSPYNGSSSVVYNGVDLNQWEYVENPTADYVVWAGRICPEKGTREAVKAALEAGVPIKVAGPVCDPDYFDRSVAPLLKLAGSYEGHLNPEELSDLIGNASGFLFSSLWEEPFGMVLIEALACGTPVIAFNSGAVPEIITEDCGAIVPKSDVAAMAKAVGELDKYDRSLCRERVAQHFTHDKMVDDYLTIYGKNLKRTIAYVA